MTHADAIVDSFEQGRLSRRQLIARLTALGAAAALPQVSHGARSIQVPAPEPARAAEPTFRATDLNHVALSVSDVQRSQQWYQKHLGLKPTGQEGFLTTGRGWLALFQGSKPGLHHYCYSIDGYDPDDAVARLEAAGLMPTRRGGRVYFDDPDGIECQLAETNVPA